MMERVFKFMSGPGRVCVYVWVSSSLIGDNDSYDIAIQDLERAEFYWGVKFDIKFRTLHENSEENTFRNEDMLRPAGRNLPIEGSKLSRLCYGSRVIYPCWDDPMTSDDIRRTWHVFYLNITEAGGTIGQRCILPEGQHCVKGRTIHYLSCIFTFMAIREDSDNPLNIYNTLAHEFGHALFMSNNRLKGRDPTAPDCNSTEQCDLTHSPDIRNLMYYTVFDGEDRKLVQEQLDAKEYSFLTNHHMLH
ncbi:hypothetical protein P9Z56_21810 [Bacillus cereus]|nr:hypothetical protein [Bacillus cereus]MEC2745834.1 hypothetical protein [Bacillus cereus]MEC2756826.1 hypothetical protein [Bacillus cereus]MEC2828857.1 hypothetical protein [Bacillus cereus]